MWLGRWPGVIKPLTQAELAKQKPGMGDRFTGGVSHQCQGLCCVALSGQIAADIAARSRLERSKNSR